MSIERMLLPCSWLCVAVIILSSLTGCQSQAARTEMAEPGALTASADDTEGWSPGFVPLKDKQVLMRVMDGRTFLSSGMGDNFAETFTCDDTYRCRIEGYMTGTWTGGYHGEAYLRSGGILRLEYNISGGYNGDYLVAAHPQTGALELRKLGEPSRDTDAWRVEDFTPGDYGAIEAEADT